MSIVGGAHIREWIGASILGSMSYFPHMAISKEGTPLLPFTLFPTHHTHY
jgi:hypothetical protein